MAVKLKVGDPAPAFELSDAHGRIVRLQDFLGQKPVVLYFYPKDNTPGCTAEACSFRDAYEDFQEVGAEVIGVSSDSSDSHQQFTGRYNLPFLLLSDPGGALRKRYGVRSTLGLLPGRVTYVINREGVICHIFNSQIHATQHVTEALKILREL